MQLRPYQNDLVEQVRQAWREGYKAPCIVLGCGGGKSCIVAEIARRTTWNGKRVLFLVHRRELVDQIFRTFVRWGVLMDLCQIGMVQTFTRRLKKLPKPALIITDENHHSLAQSYKRIYEHFSDVPRVGVTATPVRLNGDGLGDVNDKLIIGVSTKWLIAHNCLAPYDYYAPPLAIKNQKFRTRNGDFVTSDILNIYDKPKIYGDIVSHYKKLADGKQAIAYCAAIVQSEKLCDEFISNGIKAAHIDAKTPKEKRAEIIEKFRSGEIKVLSNVDLISEGFDVPDCEVSILARPTKSLTLYIQQAMRCMRHKPNKRAIIIDHAENWVRFGLPDDERKWSLEGEKKNETKGVAPVKTCPNCFAVIPASLRICPHCDFIFEQKEKKQAEGNLVKVTPEMILKRKVSKYLTPSECENMKELQEYAKQKGYKPGWAYYQAKSRGFLNGTKRGNNAAKRYPCKAVGSRFGS